MAHFLISPRILLVKINLIFSALKIYIFQKENRPEFHMSNLPFQQDTKRVIASVGPSIGALTLKSPVCKATHTCVYSDCCPGHARPAHWCQITYFGTSYPLRRQNVSAIYIRLIVFPLLLVYFSATCFPPRE